MEDYFKFRGWRSITRTVGYDWVQLNHYAIKSVDSYAIRKMRGNVNNKSDKYNSDYWSLQDRNEVRDDTMLRYTKTRNKIISQLLTDPELLQLHLSALNRAEQRLSELRQTAAYTQLVADLAIASTVPITQIVAKPPQPRDKEKIAALMSEVEKNRNDLAKSTRKLVPKDPVESVPMGSYVDGEPDLSQEPQMEWHTNHTMKLPADHRVFTGHAVSLIQNGKFERGIARRLPQALPQGATVLEIGSAVGFVAGHCANVRPDLTLVLCEGNPRLRSMLGHICAINERLFNNKFILANNMINESIAMEIVTLYTAHGANVLMLADARVSLEVLADVMNGLSKSPPLQVFLYGRLMEKWHGSMDKVESILAKNHYRADFGFDQTIARGFCWDGASSATQGL